MHSTLKMKERVISLLLTERPISWISSKGRIGRWSDVSNLNRVGKPPDKDQGGNAATERA